MIFRITIALLISSMVCAAAEKPNDVPTNVWETRKEERVVNWSTTDAEIDWMCHVWGKLFDVQFMLRTSNKTELKIEVNGRMTTLQAWQNVLKIIRDSGNKIAVRGNTVYIEKAKQPHRR